MAISIPHFAQTQLTLLASELASEIAESSALVSLHAPAALQRAGVALTNLVVNNQRTGLGGKTVLELGPDPATSSGGGGNGSGNGNYLSMGLEMKATMERLQKMSEAEYTPFIRVLFGLSSPGPVAADLTKDLDVGDIKWVDPTLNDSQKDAIRFALASSEIALIHGPPGTGKTHTLIELILQLVTLNKRILVCGPSNISVDNIPGARGAVLGAVAGGEEGGLCGDHLQLPPTIKSLNLKGKKGKGGGGEEGVVNGATLETTLFDRLLKLHGPSIKRMLTTQYRMHEDIMRFPSDELYEGRLVAAEGVKARLLKDLPYEVEDTDDTREPLIFIDTQGGDFPEKNEDEQDTGGGGKKLTKSSLYGDSKSNEMEAALVRQHVKSLVDAGAKPEDIAVVTPYNAQLAILAPLKETFPGIELGSVDGFQGREKEAVIVSLVRSNPDGEVGFLGEKRRLNVAESQMYQ
ncbi:hypothetical protein N0V88_004744 [Collariella sp. IMI 366227]|nr:hypothetical protein N0V88_004744 [Collariella sp. IMI 366227]